MHEIDFIARIKPMSRGGFARRESVGVFLALVLAGCASVVHDEAPLNLPDESHSHVATMARLSAGDRVQRPNEGVQSAPTSNICISLFITVEKQAGLYYKLGMDRMTLSEFQRRAAKARWAETTPEERRAFAMKGVLARGDKPRRRLPREMSEIHRGKLAANSRTPAQRFWSAAENMDTLRDMFGPEVGHKIYVDRIRGWLAAPLKQGTYANAG